MAASATASQIRARVVDRLAPARAVLARYRLREVTWFLLLAGATVVLIAALSSLLTVKVFHQYSTIKWATLAAIPILMAFLLIVRRPSLWVAGLVIVTVPIEPYVATIHTQPVSVLVVTATLATFVVTLEGGVIKRSMARSPAVVRVMPWVVLLLIVPTILGTSWQHEVLYVALFVDVVWICMRIASLYPDGRLVIVLVFLGSAALQSLLAMAQYATGHAFNLYGGAGTATYSTQNYFFDYGTTARTTGTFFDPISLGNVLAMAAPLALLVVLRRDLPNPYRWFAGLAGMALLGGLTVSLSRASWLGAVAGIACVALFSRGEQRRRAVSVAVTLLVAVVLVASTLYGPAIGARFDSIFHPTASNVRTSAGDKIREAEWSEAWHVFEQDPVDGVGFGHLVAFIEAAVPGTDSTSHAQNTYLQYLAEGGLFGGAVLLLLAGGVGLDLYRSRRNDWLFPGLVGSFATVAVTWVTDYTVRYMAVEGCLALLVGLAASAPGANADPSGATELGAVEEPAPARRLVEVP